MSVAATNRLNYLQDRLSWSSGRRNYKALFSSFAARRHICQNLTTAYVHRLRRKNISKPSGSSQTRYSPPLLPANKPSIRRSGRLFRICPAQLSSFPPKRSSQTIISSSSSILLFHARIIKKARPAFQVWLLRPLSLPAQSRASGKTVPGSNFGTVISFPAPQVAKPVNTPSANEIIFVRRGAIAAIIPITARFYLVRLSHLIPKINRSWGYWSSPKNADSGRPCKGAPQPLFPWSQPNPEQGGPRFPHNSGLS